MDRTLKKLKVEKNAFREALDILEASEICYGNNPVSFNFSQIFLITSVFILGLSLHSFLMLPMQRITRFRLLIESVLTKLKSDDDEYANWEQTLVFMNKIVAQCNDAANRSEQAFEMREISKSIEFPQTVKPIPIMPVGLGALPRTLVRSGELMHLVWRGDDGKLTFGKRFTKCAIHAFLFTDILVLTKKKRLELLYCYYLYPQFLIG